RQIVALVHNGIIENHEELRTRQQAAGFKFTSDTDTEVIVHQVYHYLEQHGNLLAAVQDTLRDLEGAYAVGVISTKDPDYLVAACRGSPLVIGIGIGEHFIASDVAALLPVTQRFIFLAQGHVADLTEAHSTIYVVVGQIVGAPIRYTE